MERKTFPNTIKLNKQKKTMNPLHSTSKKAIYMWKVSVLYNNVYPTMMSHRNLISQILQQFLTYSTVLALGAVLKTTVILKHVQL